MVLYLFLLPLLGSICTLLSGYFYKITALVFALVTLVFSLYIAANFSTNISAPQFLWEYGFVILGLDGISLLLTVLTALLILIVIISSWNLSRVILALYLLMGSLAIGTFCALDIFLFYIFFEASLIPMFYIIGIWGSNQKIYAAFKFFLYTLAGSVTFLLAVLYIYSITNTTNLLELPRHLNHLSWQEQKWLWLACFVTFAVKIPMLPFHTWLPDAHVQAPTGGSIFLAGILIKIGIYGFLRVSLPFFPLATSYFANTVVTLSLVAVIYASLVALNQTDIKKLIAYSSIAHMGFASAGVFSLNVHGIEAGIFQLISHGIISSALFLSVGILYERKNTREIVAYKGLCITMPLFSTLFFIITLGAIGLPGTSGFIGEFLAILGISQRSIVTAGVLGVGIIFGAWYMLNLVKKIIWGVTQEILLDINNRELTAMVSLVTLEVILGIWPNLILNFTRLPVNKLVGLY